jgi:electron transfer flavoprotein beta subunit
MKAKKKPIETRVAGDLGVDIAPRLDILETREPPTRLAGIKLESAADLVDRLKNEVGVL